MGALLYRLHIAFQAFAHTVMACLSFASRPRAR